MNRLPNFSEFNVDKSKKINEANLDQFFKTYEETENWLIEMGVKNYTIDPSTLVVDVDGDVKLANRFRSHLLPVEFGDVSGNFNCHMCRLKSLMGCPKIVGGNFDVGRNENLESLQHIPADIGGSFNCQSCKISSLQHISQKIFNGSVIVKGNRLTSLKGAPKFVGGGFLCGYQNLTSLEYGPIEVVGDFRCNDNKLSSLIGAPRSVGGDFECTGNSRLTMDSMDVDCDIKGVFKFPKQKIWFRNLSAKNVKNFKR